MVLSSLNFVTVGVWGKIVICEVVVYQNPPNLKKNLVENYNNMFFFQELVGGILTGGMNVNTEHSPIRLLQSSETRAQGKCSQNLLVTGKTRFEKTVQ